MLAGGFGSAVLEHSAERAASVRIVPIGVADRYVQHGDHQHLLEDVGLSDGELCKKIKCIFTKEENSNG